MADPFYVYCARVQAGGWSRKLVTEFDNLADLGLVCGHEDESKRLAANRDGAKGRYEDHGLLPASWRVLSGKLGLKPIR